ncbi:type II toxin-antitoxin system HicA family toxin [Candidatus Azambacteria bacterium]|nr:type II toxin-antitoxin system HicA family toxin [Candidatus Azambacteria bacterium]
MRPLTAKQLIKILEENGFWIARQRGSHRIYKNGDGIIVPVPIHGKNKSIYLGTFLAIIKQSKIPKDRFK